MDSSDFSYRMTLLECHESLAILFEALVCIIYIRESYYFCLVCTFRKIDKNYEIKVDVEKGSLKFKDKFDIKMLLLM
jgi:hypothetical protein